MPDACTYCGSDLAAHDPVFVNEGANDPDRQAGQFCNYACLASHVEEEGLTEGATCEWQPGE